MAELQMVWEPICHILTDWQRRGTRKFKQDVSLTGSQIRHGICVYYDQKCCIQADLFPDRVTGMDGGSSAGGNARFAAYDLQPMSRRSAGARPCRSAEADAEYCLGLLMPIERKSVKPMAAVTAPAQLAAKHQSSSFCGERTVVGRIPAFRSLSALPGSRISRLWCAASGRFRRSIR